MATCCEEEQGLTIRPPDDSGLKPSAIAAQSREAVGNLKHVTEQLAASVGAGAKCGAIEQGTDRQHDVLLVVDQVGHGVGMPLWYLWGALVPVWPVTAPGGSRRGATGFGWRREVGELAQSPEEQAKRANGNR